MHLLARLATAGDLEVFVPDMVRREFLTKKLQDGREKLEHAKAALQEVGKTLRRPSEHCELLNSMPAQLDALREKLELLVKEGLQKSFS